MIGKKQVNPQTLAAAIKEVTTSDEIIATARAVGERVAAEDGVANGIRFIDQMASRITNLQKTNARREKLSEEIMELRNGKSPTSAPGPKFQFECAQLDEIAIAKDEE